MIEIPFCNYEDKKFMGCQLAGLIVTRANITKDFKDEQILFKHCQMDIGVPNGCKHLVFIKDRFPTVPNYVFRRDPKEMFQIQKRIFG